MSSSSVRLLLRSVAGALIASFFFISASLAQLSPQAVSQFLANPGQTLQQFPNGGAQLVSFIRNLALSNPDTLPVIISLLANASKDQQAAIGAGLGRAAQASLQNNRPMRRRFSRRLPHRGSKTQLLLLQPCRKRADGAAAAVVWAVGGVCGPGFGSSRRWRWQRRLGRYRRDKPDSEPRTNSDWWHCRWRWRWRYDDYDAGSVSPR